MQSALAWNNLGMTEISWTLLKLAIAGAVTAVIVLRKSDIVYGLVVAWAAFGIAAGQAAIPAVAGAATLLLYIILTLAIYEFAGRWR
jgi:hypothetical protein